MVDAGERTLDLVDARDHGGRQRVPRLRQQERELAFAEDLLEGPGRDHVRVGRDDQAVDRVVLLHFRRVERRRRQQERVDDQHPPARGDDRREEAREGPGALHGLCVGAEPRRIGHRTSEVAHGRVVRTGPATKGGDARTVAPTNGRSDEWYDATARTWS